MERRPLLSYLPYFYRHQLSSSNKETVIIISEVMLAIVLVGNFIVLFFPLHAAKQQDSSSIPPSDDICSTPDCAKVAAVMLSSMNTTINPCDDFYQYACGGFEQWYYMSTGRLGSLSQDVRIEKTIQRQLRALIEQKTKEDVTKTSSARQKLRRFYKSCLADLYYTSYINQIVEEMGGIIAQPSETVPDSWSLNNAVEKYETFADTALFYSTVGPNQMNTTGQNFVTLSQGSLLIPFGRRENYLGRNVETDPVLIALTNLLEKLANLLLDDQIIDRRLVVDVVELDKKRASIQLTQAEQRNRMQNLVNVDLAWLEANFGYLNWTSYFQKVYTPVGITLDADEPIAVFSYRYFTNLAPLINSYLLTKEGRRTLQNYIILKGIIAYSFVLGGPFKSAFDEFSVALNGHRNMQERWEMCLEDVDSSLGLPLSAMFIEAFFPPHSKGRAEAIALITAAAFQNRLQQASWMDEEARNKSSKKVGTILFKTAYPDWLLDEKELNFRYSQLSIGEDYLENRAFIYRFRKFQKAKKLREIPDRLEWTTTPHTVNAFYDSTFNTVVIPAGILSSSPFFYSTDGLPPALNFGSLACILGHELTHAFDNNGRQYDDSGNLNSNWWNSNTIQEYNDRSRCFVEKFNAYDMNDGLPPNGNQTLSENFADDNGLKVAYEAYKMTTTLLPDGSFSKSLVGLDYLTGDQLFFVAYAQTWCAIRPSSSALRGHLQHEVHSPNYYRVIGPLSNSVDFNLAFNCPLTSRMNADRKCFIW